MSLFDYQAEAVDRIEAAFRSARSVCFQLPTGGGKTHVASEIVRRRRAAGRRIWFLCHSRELIDQTSKRLRREGVTHGVLAPGHEIEPDRAVQVCSISTLRRRVDLLPPADFVVWDECHHVAAVSWAALRRRLGSAQHLGLTATPERLDGLGLADWFDVLICGPTTRALIAQGRLSAYRLFAPTIPDLRGVGTRAGDYNASLLSERMSAPSVVGDAVEHYRKHVRAGRAIVFAVSVTASRALVERFNAAGIAAAHVDGGTPRVERDAAVAALKAGRIKILSNVLVFTEGFDVPSVEAVILLRPTRSRALYLQMVGRALRAARGKRATIVLDHAGLVYEHGLPDEPCEWTLQGSVSTVERAPVGSRLRRCPECSAVHEWLAECPECGHTYVAADRSIVEVYGELREIPRRDGFETAADFARRIGRHRVAVHKMKLRGLPVASDGSVHIEQGLEWYTRYRARVDERLARAKPKANREVRAPWQGDTIRRFAARIGAKPEAVQSWLRQGMPRNTDLSIPAEAAIQWLRETPLSTKGHAPPGHEAPKAFARRLGLSGTGGLRGLKARGLPIESNGFVHVETALAWRESNLTQEAKAPEWDGRRCYETRAAGVELTPISRRLGLHEDTLRERARVYAQSRGLPWPIPGPTQGNGDGMGPSAPPAPVGYAGTPALS